MEDNYYKTPEIGKTCPAMTNEYYDYKLSGDAGKHCTCKLNNIRCIGIVVVDLDDQSSQFFSRGKCQLVESKITDCPVYGASKKTIGRIIKEKAEKELKEKLKGIE
jgi:hypothetical protein